MQLLKTTTIVLSSILLSTTMTTFKAHAANTKVELAHTYTTITYQVTTTKQMQQDEIIASLRIEKMEKKSDDVQSKINDDMKSALELSKKYPKVKTSTGRYFVYKDEQKSQWKGSQTILLDSFDQSTIAQFAGELQKNGFVIDNYSYTLSEKNRRSLDDEMRVELLQKASQIATNVIAKGLNKKFIRFAQIDFNSQNYYPVISLTRSFSSANAALKTTSNPVAQAGSSDVQMSANISALFEN